MIKVAHIGKSAALTDIQDLPVCLCQKINCIFQTFLINILSRRFPTNLFQQPAEMAGRAGSQLAHFFVAFLEIFNL